jgi:hypothetical protein
VQVHINHPSEVNSLKCAGVQVAQPNRDAFLIKPFIPQVTIEDAQRLPGIGLIAF